MLYKSEPVPNYKINIYVKIILLILYLIFFYNSFYVENVKKPELTL